jgi:hypothetical protein
MMGNRSGPDADVGGVLNSLLYSVSIGTLMTLPHWLQRFGMSGTAMEDRFLANHYSLASAWHLSDGAGLLLTLIIGAAVFTGRLTLPRLIGPLYPVAASLLAAAFVLYVLAYGRYMIFYGLGRISYFDWNTLPQFLTIMDWGVIAAILVTVLSFLARRREAGQFACWVLRRTVPIGCALGIAVSVNGIWAYILLGAPLSIPITPQATDRSAGAAPGLRVVWLLFDKLDRKKAFENRDASVEMPTFDGLIARSVTFTAAMGPTKSGTQRSMTGILTGHVTDDIKMLPGQLQARAEGEERYFALQDRDKIFARAQSQGFSVAITSHHMIRDEISNPYCRMFRHVLAKCWNEGRWIEADTKLADAMALVLRRLWGFVQLDPGRPATRRQQEVLEGTDKFKAMMAATGEAAANPDIDLVFAHIFAPHWPYIFDRKTNDFAYHEREYPSSDEGYLGGLELADRGLRRVLADISASRVQKRTAIVVTADHGDYTRFVPLIVYLPTDAVARKVAGPAPTEQLARLVSGLLEGELEGSSDVARVFRSSGSAAAKQPRD